jgi:hypothetical protein
MKLCYSALIFMAAGCATTGPKTKQPESITEVNVGDKLTMTEKGLTDCVLDVKNVISAQPTPIGFLDVNPAVCGTLTCSKGSISGAENGVPACIKLEAFQPEGKRKLNKK